MPNEFIGYNFNIFFWPPLALIVVLCHAGGVFSSIAAKLRHLPPKTHPQHLMAQRARAKGLLMATTDRQCTHVLRQPSDPPKRFRHQYLCSKVLIGIEDAFDLWLRRLVAYAISDNRGEEADSGEEEQQEEGPTNFALLVFKF